ncbi:MAG: hypothetical protein ACI36Y_05105 [Coriobacteriales bacterium]
MRPHSSGYARRGRAQCGVRRQRVTRRTPPPMRYIMLSRLD